MDAAERDLTRLEALASSEAIARGKANVARDDAEARAADQASNK